MSKPKQATKTDAPMSAEDYLLDENFKSDGKTPLDMNDTFGSVKALLSNILPIEQQISKVRPLITNGKWIVVAMITSDISAFVTKKKELAKHCKQKAVWKKYLMVDCGLGEDAADSIMAACAPQDNQNWKLIPAKSTFAEVAHIFRTNGLTSLGKIKAKWQLGDWTDKHQTMFEAIIKISEPYYNEMNDRDKALVDARVSTVVSFIISRNK